MWGRGEGNPSPEGFLFSLPPHNLIRVLVLLEAFGGHLVGEGVVHPRLIGDDHGDAAEGYAKHDLEGQLAGRAVEDRHAVRGIDAGDDDAGIHAEHAEEGHGNDEQCAEEGCRPRSLPGR